MAHNNQNDETGWRKNVPDEINTLQNADYNSSYSPCRRPVKITMENA